MYNKKKNQISQGVYTMKKMLKSVTALALTALMAVGFTACNQTEVINAYDIAVQNGFMGTEAEWLASLQGINGQDGKDLDIDEVYKSAQADGYTGTLLEFIQEYLNVDLREDNDKTQSQIAKVLNMQLTVYQRYERGEREIPFWVAIKLADYYNVSLDYIAERSYGDK